MTPSHFLEPARQFISSTSGYTLSTSSVNNIPYGVRPVINLKPDVFIESGDGTSGSGAYKVRLAS